jgi:predicted nucleic acid-binding protein
VAPPPGNARGSILRGSEPLAVGDVILTEVLQGFGPKRDFNQAKHLLAALDMVTLAGQDIAVLAARNFRKLCSKGINMRKTIDAVIATRFIESRYRLLYSDRDFDPSVEHPGLRSVLTAM